MTHWLTHCRLCAHHLYVAFCALAAALNADRWTDKKKVPVRDAWGFVLFLWCLGSCTWSLMQLVETGDLLRVCLDVESLCLWEAALWMMKRRHTLVPLLFVFTLGTSIYGTYKITFGTRTSAFGFSSFTISPACVPLILLVIPCKRPVKPADVRAAHMQPRWVARPRDRGLTQASAPKRNLTFSLLIYLYYCSH